MASTVHETAIVITGDGAGGVKAVKMNADALKQLQEQSARTGAAQKKMATDASAAERAISAGKASYTQVATAVGAVTTALVGLSTKVRADVIADQQALANSLGMSTQALQQWQFAAERVHLSADKMGDILKDVADKVGDFAANGGGEAADLFKNLNLQITDFIGLSPDQQLLKVAQAISQVQDRGQQVTYLEMLADDASRLLPLLDNNATGFQKLADQAIALGVALPDYKTDKIVEYNQAIQVLLGSLSGVGNELSYLAADNLTGPIETLTELFSTSSDYVQYLDDALIALAAVMASRYVPATWSAVAANTSLVTTLLAGITQGGALGRAMAIVTLRTNVMAAASRALSSALTLVTGPAGIFLAVTGLSLYAANSQTAAERSDELSGYVDKLGTSFANMSKKMAAAELVTLTSKLQEAKTLAADVQAEIDKLSSSNAYQGNNNTLLGNFSNSDYRDQQLTGSSDAMTLLLAQQEQVEKTKAALEDAEKTLESIVSGTYTATEGVKGAVGQIGGDVENLISQYQPKADKLRETLAKLQAAYNQVKDTDPTKAAEIQAAIGEVNRQLAAADTTGKAAAKTFKELKADVAQLRGEFDPVNDKLVHYNDALVTVNKAHDAGILLLDEYATASKFYQDAIERAQITPLQQLISEMQVEYSQMQMTNRERAIDIALRKAQQQAQESNIPLTEEQSDKIKALAGKMYDLQAAQDAAKDAAKPFADALSDAASRVDESFANAFKGAYDSFGDFADSMLESLKDLLAEMAYQLTIRPLVVQLQASLTGTSTSSVGGITSGAAGTSGISGLSSLSGISNITSLFTGNSIGNGISDIYSGLASSDWLSGTGAGNALGGAAGNAGAYANWQYGVAGIAGSLFGNLVGGNETSGTLGGTGATIGMSVGGPWGAVIGAVAGTVLGMAFGDEDKPPEYQYGIAANDQEVATQIGLDYKAGGYSPFGGMVFRTKDAEDQDTEIASKIQDDVYTALTAYETSLASMLSETDLANAQDSLQSYVANGKNNYVATGEDGQATLNRYIDIRLKAILGGVDGEVLDAFNAAGVSGDDAYVYAQGLLAIRSAWQQSLPIMDNLPDSYAGVVDVIEGMAADGESLATAFSRINSEFALVYTATDKLHLQFSLTGTAALEAASNIIELAGGMDAFVSSTQAYYQAFYSEQEQFNASTEALQQALADVNLTLPSTRDGYRSMVEALDLNTEAGQQAYVVLMNAATAADNYYDVVEAGTYAMTDAMKALQDQISDLSSTATDALSDQLSIAKELRSQASDLADVYRKASDSLQTTWESLQTGDLSTRTASDQYTYLNSQFGALASAAKSGDTDALSSLGDAAKSLLEQSRVMYSSSDLYTADYQRVLDALTTAGLSADVFGNVENAKTDALDVQIGALEAIQAELAKDDPQLSAIYEQLGLIDTTNDLLSQLNSYQLTENDLSRQQITNALGNANAIAAAISRSGDSMSGDLVSQLLELEQGLGELGIDDDGIKEGLALLHAALADGVLTVAEKNQLAPYIEKLQTALYGQLVAVDLGIYQGNSTLLDVLKNSESTVIAVRQLISDSLKSLSSLLGAINENGDSNAQVLADEFESVRATLDALGIDDASVTAAINQVEAALADGVLTVEEKNSIAPAIVRLQSALNDELSELDGAVSAGNALASALIRTMQSSLNAIASAVNESGDSNVEALGDEFNALKTALQALGIDDEGITVAINAVESALSDGVLTVAEKNTLLPYIVQLQNILKNTSAVTSAAVNRGNILASSLLSSSQSSLDELISAVNTSGETSASTLKQEISTLKSSLSALGIDDEAITDAINAVESALADGVLSVEEKNSLQPLLAQLQAAVKNGTSAISAATATGNTLARNLLAQSATSLSNLQAAVNSAGSTQVGALKQQFDTLKSALSALEIDDDGITSAIDAVEAALSDGTLTVEEKNSLQPLLAQLQTAVKNGSATLTAVNQQGNAVATALLNQSKSSLTSLQSAVNSTGSTQTAVLRNQLTSLRSSLSALEIDDDGITAAIDDVEAALSDGTLTVEEKNSLKPALATISAAIAAGDKAVLAATQNGNALAQSLLSQSKSSLTSLQSAVNSTGATQTAVLRNQLTSLRSSLSALAIDDDGITAAIDAVESALSDGTLTVEEKNSLKPALATISAAIAAGDSALLSASNSGTVAVRNLLDTSKAGLTSLQTAVATSGNTQASTLREQFNGLKTSLAALGIDDEGITTAINAVESALSDGVLTVAEKNSLTPYLTTIKTAIANGDSALLSATQSGNAAVTALLTQSKTALSSLQTAVNTSGNTQASVIRNNVAVLRNALMSIDSGNDDINAALSAIDSALSDGVLTVAEKNSLKPQIASLSAYLLSSQSAIYSATNRGNVLLSQTSANAIKSLGEIEAAVNTAGDTISDDLSSELEDLADAVEAMGLNSDDVTLAIDKVRAALADGTLTVAEKNSLTPYLTTLKNVIGTGTGSSSLQSLLDAVASLTEAGNDSTQSVLTTNFASLIASNDRLVSAINALAASKELEQLLPQIDALTSQISTEQSVLKTYQQTVQSLAAEKAEDSRLLNIVNATSFLDDRAQTYADKVGGGTAQSVAVNSSGSLTVTNANNTEGFNSAANLWRSLSQAVNAFDSLVADNDLWKSLSITGFANESASTYLGSSLVGKLSANDVEGAWSAIFSSLNSKYGTDYDWSMWFDSSSLQKEIASLTQQIATAQGNTSTQASRVQDLQAQLAALQARADELDGSHASGLSVVPFDGYRAELHRGEAVIDASFMSGLRRYGIPVSEGGGNSAEVVAELRAMRAELAQLRADNAQLMARNNAAAAKTAEATELTARRLQSKANLESLA